MTGAMYAAIGGLKSHMNNLNVIGNNIANVNTEAYKAQRMTFQESIYTTSRSGSNGGVTAGGNNPSQIGYGSSVGSIDLNMNPGTYAPTGFGLDCMMMGEGFFLVGDKGVVTTGGAADLTKFSLTRKGDFWKDPNGFIADRQGSIAYGFGTVYNPYKDAGTEASWLGFDQETLKTVTSQDCNTITSSALGPLRLPLSAAKPTKENGGLNGDEEQWQTGDPVYDLMGPVQRNADGKLYRSTVSMADLVSNVVTNALTDQKANATNPTDGSTTHYVAGDAAAGTPDTWYYVPEGGAYAVKLDANKNILGMYFADGTGTANGGIDATTGDLASNYNYTWTFAAGQAPTITAAAKPGVTPPNGATAPTTFWTYNGPLPNKEVAPIEPVSMSISKEGAIVCQNDNGQTVIIGYLAVGSCASNDGVTHVDGPYYKCQEGAGDMRVAALKGTLKGRYMNNMLTIDFEDDGNGQIAQVNIQPPANDAILQGGTNEIRNGGLEKSTADVATEFSNLILTQRGYQANTRIVTVTDSMLEELVNIKR